MLLKSGIGIKSGHIIKSGQGMPSSDWLGIMEWWIWDQNLALSVCIREHQIRSDFICECPILFMIVYQILFESARLYSCAPDFIRNTVRFYSNFICLHSKAPDSIRLYQILFEFYVPGLIRERQILFVCTRFYSRVNDFAVSEFWIGVVWFSKVRCKI